MKQLTRSRDDKWLGGVCGGLSAYTGIDASIIRVVTAVCILLGAGALFIGYFIAWLLIPREPAQPAWTAPSGQTDPATASVPSPPSV